MDKRYWRRIPMSLYRITLYSLVYRTNFDVGAIQTLPGHIKEDLMQLGLLRKRGKINLSGFLHPNIMRLDTFQTEITSEDLVEISKCQRLRLLVINPPKFQGFCHPSFCLEQLFSNLPFLVKVHITNNNGMTDDVIAVIAKKCHLVQELDVSRSLNLTDLSAKSLTEMIHLRALDLSDTTIGDWGLRVLSEGPHSKQITYLKLNNCVNISDEGIYSLIHGCDNLRKLVVCGWPRVSIECQLALNTFLNRHAKRKNTWVEFF